MMVQIWLNAKMLYKELERERAGKSWRLLGVVENRYYELVKAREKGDERLRVHCMQVDNGMRFCNCCVLCCLCIVTMLTEII